MFLLQAVAERSGMNLTDLQCITILTSTGPITAGRPGGGDGAHDGLGNRRDRPDGTGGLRAAGEGPRRRATGDRTACFGKLESTGAGFFASSRAGCSKS